MVNYAHDWIEGNTIADVVAITVTNGQVSEGSALTE
jgi:hypothetical protein